MADRERNPRARPAAPATERKGDLRRQRLIDAALACFVEEGWARTNMSMIARRAGVTRGMMQYYFPTLDDALKASVDHLNRTWRRLYFEAIDSHRREAPAEVFAFGIDQLWRRVQEPLHVAKQELEAAARTDRDLRAVMEAAALDDEADHTQAGMRAYPELADLGADAFHAARDFTLVFLEGLSLYRFPTQAEARRARQLALLKLFLAQYWRAQGVSEGVVGAASTPALKAEPPGPDKVAEAAALIGRALALLEDAAPDALRP